MKVASHAREVDMSATSFLPRRAPRLQLLAKRADAIERRLSGAAPDLSDPVERVKEHWLRSQATSVKFKVRCWSDSYLCVGDIEARDNPNEQEARRTHIS